MKPAPFSYHRAASVEEAVSLLAGYGGEAKVLAGGQSLMPMLAFRLVSPAALIDIGRVPGLDAIAAGPGGVTIGARVRWCDIERSAAIRTEYPLIHDAIRHVAHPQIRNRGTIGGSLAHADPAAEWPAVVLAAGGTIEVAGQGGRRTVRAGDFFRGLLATALGEAEIITAVHIPKPARGSLWGFAEFARRRGDYALAGIALQAEMRDGVFVRPSLVGFGIGDRPTVLAAAQAALDGAPPRPDVLARAVAAAEREIEPQEDPQAPPAYRRALLGTLLGRALTAALARCREPA